MWGEQKGSSILLLAGMPSSFPAFQRGRLIATYFYVRLISKDFGHLVSRSASEWKPLKELSEAERNLFEQPLKNEFSTSS